MAWTVLPVHIMGTRVLGDCGGFTMYTDRTFRKVIYKKAPPDKPPSRLQVIQRARFRNAVNAWKALSDDAKAALERTVTRLSLCLTGQNLFTSCAIRHKDDVYATIARQAGEVLPPLPWIE